MPEQSGEPVKQTKCKICRGLYTKWSITQKVCPNPLCALELVKIDKAKKARKEHQAAKVKARTRSEWMKLAQQAFNKFIRLRDKDQLCICCDRPLETGSIGGGYDCGHYRSIGSAPHLRFYEHNAHGQTKQCNRWGSGRAVDYRLGLIKRIGVCAVESLEADQNPKKYTIPDLIAIRAEYAEKVKKYTKTPQ